MVLYSWDNLYSSLERIYKDYNSLDYLSPDPLEFLHKYRSKTEKEAEIEIIGLISSSLAYGRVGLILKAVDNVLKRMEYHPYNFLISSSNKDIERRFSDFKYRFTTNEDITSFLIGIKKCLKEYGSLKECFNSCYDKKDYISSVSRFVNKIGVIKSFFPDPLKKSSCKRLHLFFRWMVRSDNIDLGIWNDVLPPSNLRVPLDTHMQKISSILMKKDLKKSDASMVEEITEFFRHINPKDPIKYDFCLTRFGIQKDLNYDYLKKY